MQEANKRVNDPKATEEDCVEDIESLINASSDLRSNDGLKSALISDIRAATKDFRKWEQVGDVYLTLEPFAMSNGLYDTKCNVPRK